MRSLKPCLRHQKYMLIRNGNFKRWVRVVLSLIGIALLIGGLRYDSYLVSLLGFLIGSVGMYASKASMLGIKPFSDSPEARPEPGKENSGLR